MDTLCQDYPNIMNNLKFDHGPIPCSSSRNLVIPGYDPCLKNSNPHLPNKSPSSSSSSSSSTSGLSSEVDSQDSNTVLKYISDMLMEEDLEGKTCMLQDCLALQATEKPFYDVLGQEYPYKPCDSPPFSCNPCQTEETPDDSFNGSRSGMGSNNNYSAAFLVSDSTQSGLYVSDCLDASLVDSPGSTLWGPNLGWDIWQSAVVSKGFGAGIPLPSGGSFEFARQANSYSTSSDEETDGSPENSWGRKNHHREEGDHIEEERSNKQVATSLAEPEAPSEMFDEVLLCPPESVGYGHRTFVDNSQNGASRRQRKGAGGQRSRGKKRGNKEELVDLWTLLTQCAQAVAGNDQRTSYELLRQIRQHNSPYGDVNQRLAHYFAIALETRLEGTRTPAYSPFFSLASYKAKMVDILRAYQVYVKACPFKRMSYFFANRTILKQAEKASRLHIIDFGILYGFQWPCLIQRLSERSNGPPKLKITGIELPQPGFRPAERVEETIRRLEKYCERFHVPFEYHVIAKKWETIKYEDFNINRDEMIVVNSMYRLKNIADDTVAAISARDTVLNLINQINPDFFLFGIVNGTYSAPFFVTRFKEALFHFSSYFDMFEATVPREDEARILFEKEIFARDLSNVVACEGTERVERPETYKQWQTRNLRAGFRQLPLDKDIMKKVRDKMMVDYHKDFVLDEDGMWMLQGWKGRITHALSVWKPVHE